VEGQANGSARSSGRSRMSRGTTAGRADRASRGAGADRAAGRPDRPDRSSRSNPSRRAEGRAARAERSNRAPSGRGSRQRKADGWARLAPVPDVDGPRVRLGVAWFCVAMPAVMVASLGAGLVYGIAAGLAARQVVRTWRSPGWQADAAVALAVVPPLAAVGGVIPGLGALAVAGVAAMIIGASEPLDGLDDGVGRFAAAGVVLQAVVPVAVAATAVVLVRAQSPEAAVLLVGLASAYEMGDFLVGSGASNPVEGPLAGGAALIVVGFPLAILLVEPFNVMGIALLGVAAICCPVGQWIASALLPRPEAKAPALRRIDTLLLLGPLWAIAAGAL
jgi:hypothetical protein